MASQSVLAGPTRRYKIAKPTGVVRFRVEERGALATPSGAVCAGPTSGTASTARVREPLLFHIMMLMRFHDADADQDD